MVINFRSYLLCLLLAFTTTTLFAQTTKNTGKNDKDKKTQGEQIEPEKLKEYEDRVRSLVSFMQFMYNTLGEEESSVRDKETIVNQSFQKIFKDKNVQVEDDLIDKRDLWMNKNVQSYLKDIDFFYKNATFKYTVNSIAHRVAPDGTIFFTATTNRALEGTNFKNEKVKNNLPRYIDMSYDVESQDLKIISIYTSQANETEVLRSWWNDLPAEWLAVFSEYVTIPVGDSISNSQLHSIVGMEVLDISNNPTVKDIQPISRLMKLKTFKCANTQVSNLFPLRSITNLEVLDASNTPIQDLLALTYATNLRELNVSNTKVNEIKTLEYLTNLERLDLSITGVNSLEALGMVDGSSLKELRISKTKVANLDPVKNVSTLQFLEASFTPLTSIAALSETKELERLDISNTNISSLEPLSKLEKLRLLYANNTKITSLKPLISIAALERVYCDNTGVKLGQAQELTQTKSNVLVVYESEALQNWWKNLSFDWKEVFKTASKLTPSNPTKEELATLSRITKIDARGQSVKTVEPLRIFESLKEINISRTGVSDITALRDLIALEVLEANNTKISDVSPLQSLARLKKLDIENTAVSDISTLQNLTNLEFIYADGAALKDELVAAFLSKNPSTVVIYKTVTLNNWWTGLSESWKTALKKHVKIETQPNKEQLHAMIYLESINLDGISDIRDLQPLQMCVRLRELSFVRTSVSNLSPIKDVKTLRILRFSETPVSNLEPITTLKDLEQLVFENTPVESLEPMGAFKKLKRLNCAGTQIRTVKCLEPLKELTELSCNTTKLRNLKGLENMRKLEILRCYNTKISKGKVDDFKEDHPRCEVIYY
ncbi:leucine-rich repeat domain-containing protein [Bernardetia sp. Wsw4-3y2]|uniref:leucine-rich repeat domain-containing protein n=1 Tax=unclassified Bernardetia TaxID=2647129 RepID=UPI0030CB6711